MRQCICHIDTLPIKFAKVIRGTLYNKVRPGASIHFSDGWGGGGGGGGGAGKSKENYIYIYIYIYITLNGNLAGHVKKWSISRTYIFFFFIIIYL